METYSTFSTAAERERWNDLVFSSPCGHLMQTCEWGDYKSSIGWQVHRIAVERSGRLVAGAQMLLRPVPFLPLTIAYVPKGPVADWEDEVATTMLLSAIHQVARSQRAIFLKVEPNLPDENRFHSALRELGFQPTALTNQPRSTLVVALSGGEAALLSRMRAKSRKLIRRAARMGVEIVEGGHQDIHDFYTVLESTAHIKSLPLHSQAFYEQAWQAFNGQGSVKLLLARYRGATVAGKMIFLFGDKSLHLWGGTSPIGRQVYASYLLQWEALRWALSRGCRYSDLWGIPDEIAEMLRQGDPVPKESRGGLWGVYTFKRGFGGDIECYVGAYDYVYQPWLYRVGVNVLMRNRSVDGVSNRLEKLRWWRT